MSGTFFTLTTQNQENLLQLQGPWTLEYQAEIESQLVTVEKKKIKRLVIEPNQIKRLDTIGVWILLRWINKIQKQGMQVTLNEFPNEFRAMAERVRAASLEEKPALPEPIKPIKFAIIHLGEATVGMWQQMALLIAFLGQSILGIAQLIATPKQWRLADLSRHIEESGINALPIIAMGAFLISVVLAYQGAHQLQQFGADIYTVDLVSISILREMGVLLTAILVAGRSGSAFAAELGMMQVNQEIDALRTLGLSPITVLVLPRMIGLVISLPLLTFFADIMGLAGGAILLYSLLDISFYQFIDRLQLAIVFSTYWVGIVKAPVFAILIALIGCMRGMQATGSAEKVGQLTTKAVVESIMAVILFDALFSVIFTKWNV